MTMTGKVKDKSVKKAWYAGRQGCGVRRCRLEQRRFVWPERGLSDGCVRAAGVESVTESRCQFQFQIVHY